MNLTSGYDPLQLGEVDADLFSIAASGDNVYVVWGNGDILFRKSTDRGDTFGPTINLSDTVSDFSYQPDFVVEGDDVHVLWATNDNLYFRISHDGGTSFEPLVDLGPHGSVQHELAVSGNNVYAVSGTSMLFRVSHDNGATFEPAVSLGFSPQHQDYPNIAAAGSNVYVVWETDRTFLRASNDYGMTFGPTIEIGPDWHAEVAAAGENVYVSFGQSDLFVRTSNDGGATFEPAIPLGGVVNSKSIDVQRMGTSGDNLYIVWQEKFGQIMFSVSHDGGATFTEAVNLASDLGDVASFFPNLAIAEPNVYASWASPSGIFFRSSDDNGGTFGPTMDLSEGWSTLPEADASGDKVYLAWLDPSQRVQTPECCATELDVFFKAGTIESTDLETKITDFNGDGYSDLAIGVPLEDHDGVVDGGAVNVIYGSPDGLSAMFVPDQMFHQGSTHVEGTPEPYDFFGAAVASGDFDGDSYSDLVIGVPGEDIDGMANVGGVNVLYGSPSGLSPTETRPDQFWSKHTAEIEAEISACDFFGFGVTTGDFNGDGYDDLAVGSPSHSGYEGPCATDLFTPSGSPGGSVNIIYGSPIGLSATITSDQIFSGPDAISGLGFGSRLTTGDFDNDGYHDLAIGFGGATDPSEPADEEAGSVTIIYGSTDGLSERSRQVWNEDNIGFSSGLNENFGASVAAGDFNGDDYDDLAIGADNEDVDGAIFAGNVYVMYGSTDGLSPTDADIAAQRWHQGLIGLDGDAEEGDAFGSSLASGDLNGDGYSDLAIGVPLEDLRSVADAGAVNIIYGSSKGLRVNPVRSDSTGQEDQLWTQNSPKIRATAEAGDHFGGSITIGNFDGDGFFDLAVGVPGEDLTNNAMPDAGMVNVIYGSTIGLSATANQGWRQDTPGIEGATESGDAFGML